MKRLLQEFFDELLPPVFADRSAGIDPWFFSYFSELERAEGRRRYARALAADLALARFDPRGKVAVDAGSGFGVTLLGLASLGARCAVGVERFIPMARAAERLRAWRAPRVPAHTVIASVGELPLATGTADFIYCHEAISHFLDPSRFLAEAARALRPGGILMICDGNNAANRRTVAQVHEVWKRFEEGPPAENLHGHRIERPYRARRREMIDAALPGLAGDIAERLAWGTFGRHGEAVAAEARALLDSGDLPSAPPAVDRCPVDPDKGDHIENLVDPGALAGELRALGLSVKVHAHFGGARGPAVAAANRVLRALTPLTIPYARSVKVVAVRR
jgi:SAM-dependent methyltransferase